MSQILEFLSGKKTYICGFVIVLVAGLQQLGVIDPSLAQTVIELFGGAGLVSLRLGINK